jgi:hypothetical protein
MRSMSSVLEGIRTFIVEHAVLAETIGFLRHVGFKGCEGFVLWSGRTDAPGAFRVKRAIVPDQRAMVTDQGLLVVVDGDALFRVNKFAYEQGETLCGQVHSHPTDAYHSSTDDDYPLVTLQGSLSVVIPDFAAHAPGDIEMWAWYRLVDYGEWEPLPDSVEVVLA